MKNILIAISIAVVAACATPGLIPMEPVVTRSITRVLDRHDEYVNTDPSIGEDDVRVFLSQSAAVRVTIISDEVDGVFLLILLEPVMIRHDAFISGDAGLEQIERDIYLNSTARLRSLLAPQPVPAL